MNNNLLLATAILGVLLLVIYGLRCFFTGKSFQTKNVLLILLNTYALCLAILLAIAPFNADAWALIQDIKVYIFIVGVVAFITHCQELWKYIDNQ